MESTKSWSDYVVVQYEYLENKRKKPVRICLPKLKFKKEIRAKMVMVIRPKLRSTSWIADLSSKIKQ